MPAMSSYTVKAQLNLSGGAPSTPQPWFPGQDRVSRAISMLIKNLEIALPSVVFFVVEIILGGIFALIGFMTILGTRPMPFFSTPSALMFITLTEFLILSLISGIILVVLYSITVTTTMYGISDIDLNTPLNLSSALSRGISSLGRISLMILILILFYFLSSFTGSTFLSWFIDGIVSIPLYIMVAGIVLSKPMSITGAINWFSKAINVDGFTALIIFLGSLFSMIPVINILAIPFTSALTYIAVKEIT